MKYIIRPTNKVIETVLKDIGNLHPEKEWEVTIKPYKKSRTNNQNALYWKWLTIISEHTGYTQDELHEGMKRNFIGEDIGSDIFGNTYIRAKSTTNLTTKEFTEYMDKVNIFAANEGLVLPSPDYYGL